MGGISADDPAAIEKLQKKLDGLERSQLIMKEVNAYYRKHGKLDGCALLSPDQIEKLKASMASSWRSDPRPFESYQLTNNNAEIRRVKARIEQLSKLEGPAISTEGTLASMAKPWFMFSASLRA